MTSHAGQGDKAASALPDKHQTQPTQTLGHPVTKPPSTALHQAVLVRYVLLLPDTSLSPNRVEVSAQVLITGLTIPLTSVALRICETSTSRSGHLQPPLPSSFFLSSSKEAFSLPQAGLLELRGNQVLALSLSNQTIPVLSGFTSHSHRQQHQESPTDTPAPAFLFSINPSCHCRPTSLHRATSACPLHLE